MSLFFPYETQPFLPKTETATGGSALRKKVSRYSKSNVLTCRFFVVLIRNIYHTKFNSIPAFTCLKLTMETSKQCMKDFQN